MVTRCKFRGRRGILCDVLKIHGSLARNIDFEVAIFQVLRKTRRKTSILKLQSVNIGGSLAQNARFGAPTCLVSRLWFSRGLAVGSCKNLSFCHVANCENWKSLVRNAGFSASTCLVSSRWFSCGFAVSMGKLQNLSFSNVSKQVVMSFCVAGVALSDIPTCLMMFRKCQNWRKPRTKCWFFCIHVSCLESLVFLWRRRVYGGSWKTSPIRMCPSRLSCRFAWQAWPL